MAKDLEKFMTPALADTPRPGNKVDLSFLPKTDNIEELCRAATPKTMRRLIQIALEADKDSDAIKAIEHIHDRAWGKPTQKIEGAISLEQIDRTIAALERRMQTKGVDLEPIDLEAETIN